LTGRFVVTRPGDQIGADLSPGEEVALIGPDDRPVAYAKAADLWVGDLALIPASILEMEQNPLHRTYSGLIMGLRGLLLLAGEADTVAPTSKVTAIIFDFSRGSLVKV
jgi:hypothetical protein